MIINIIITVLGLFVIGAGLILSIHRVRGSNAEQVKTDWIKYGMFFRIVAVFLISVFIGPVVFGCLLGGLVAMAGYEIRKNLKDHYQHTTLAIGTITIIIAVSLAHLLLLTGREWSAWCAFFLMLVFVADSYAELIGRLGGKHHLCPRISPHKTVEGFIGSVIAAAMSAMIFSFMLPHTSTLRIIVLGIMTALSAAAGDLIFSSIKRKIGIKDFSNLLPGHGGILDRFDSLIVAAPVFFWGRVIMDHIPGGVS